MQKKIKKKKRKKNTKRELNSSNVSNLVNDNLRILRRFNRKRIHNLDEIARWLKALEHFQLYEFIFFSYELLNVLKSLTKGHLDVVCWALNQRP